MDPEIHRIKIDPDPSGVADAHSMLSTIHHFCWVVSMHLFHKILGIGLLVTALVYGVLKILGGVGFDENRKEHQKTSLPDSMTRYHRGENASDPAGRNLRMRTRKMTSAEAAEFIKNTIIPAIHFENITLKDAVKVVNDEIAKQTPDDQARPKILLHPDLHKTQVIDGETHERKMPVIDELRLRNVPISFLLKCIVDKTGSRVWFYEGNYFISLVEDVGLGDFYTGEKLSRVRLENIDASQLASKFNEIIENHDYFGPKTNITILTTEKARAALLRGELQLPRINLDVENVTSMEAMNIIAEKSDGAFMMEQFLYYNPFNEDPESGNPFSSSHNPNTEAASFGVVLDENILKPKSNFPPSD